MALPCDLLHEKESEAEAHVLFHKKCNFEKKKYFSNKKAEINV